MPREIVEIISEAASKQVPPVPVLNDLPSFQNIHADKNAAFPIIYIDEPLISNGVITSADAIRETYTVRMMFLNRDTKTPSTPVRSARFDSTQQQHDKVIKEMRELSKQIIADVYKKEFDNTREVKEIAALQWTNIRNEFNANLSGVALTLEMELNNVDGLCPTP